jgi:hypothetical protein
MIFKINVKAKTHIMKKTIITLVFFASVISTFGQNTESIVSNRKYEISWAPNFYNVTFGGNAYQEFKKEFPNSLLAESPDTFQVHFQNSNRKFWGAGPFLSWEFGTKVPVISTSNFQTTFRVSADVGRVSLHSHGRNYTETFIESGYSNQFSNTYYGRYDSVQTDIWNVTLTGVNVSLLSDMIVRFRCDKRFSFYAGLGLGVGSTIGTKTQIEHIVKEFVEFSSPETDIQTTIGSSPYYYNEWEAQDVDRTTQVVKTKSALSTFVYIPFGVDFSLGDSGFWSRNSIFLEGQIGIRFNDMLLGRSGVYKHLSHGAGYRFVF